MLIQNSFNAQPIEKIFLLITEVPMCDVILVAFQHVNTLRNKSMLVSLYVTFQWAGWGVVGWGGVVWGGVFVGWGAAF